MFGGSALVELGGSKLRIYFLRVCAHKRNGRGTKMHQERNLEVSFFVFD